MYCCADVSGIQVYPNSTTQLVLKKLSILTKWTDDVQSRCSDVDRLNISSVEFPQCWY